MDGYEFLQEENALVVPMKASLPLSTANVWGLSSGPQPRLQEWSSGGFRGTGTTSVHREHSSWNRKLPMVSTVKDLRGKQAGGGATQVLPVLWGHNTSSCCIAYLDILSGLNLLYLCWNDFLVAHRWLSSSNAKGEQIESLGTDLRKESGGGGETLGGRHYEGRLQEAFACSVTFSYQIFPELIFAKRWRVWTKMFPYDSPRPVNSHREDSWPWGNTYQNYAPSDIIGKLQIAQLSWNLSFKTSNNV